MRLADSSDTSSRTDGDLARYVAGRERQGRRGDLLFPNDPEALAEALAIQLGGRWLARGYLLAALEAVEGEPRYWRDCNGNKVRTS